MAEFTVDQARAFYDRFGRKQDWQRFYEDPAIGLLIEHAAFNQAHRIFEFGCGTGRFAQRLLREVAPTDCSYVGMDVSATMVNIARQRLEPWSGRADVRLSDGSVRMEEPDRSVDRFVSNYVFDLLGPEQINRVLTQAHRVLVPERVARSGQPHSWTWPVCTRGVRNVAAHTFALARDGWWL
ncbi:MAG: class I SAM-dependent methyltransferase [Candidatus Binataceae bacterium]